MKIAVPYENGQVFQHFGHTRQMKIYDAENGKIVQEQIADTTDSGHSALVNFLSGLRVDVLICGGIGGGAWDALAQAGIKPCGGVTGGADEAVNAFLSGTLEYSSDVQCSHHGYEHHGGHCGENKHGCGGEGTAAHKCRSHIIKGNRRNIVWNRSFISASIAAISLPW
ncbi:NifB/NifX family molybdenum-iron cluster-binding protein [Oscillospiraceae bacterium 50-60]